MSEIVDNYTLYVLPKQILKPKCGMCKCYWAPNEGDIKSSGKLYRSCRKCREYIKKHKCEHGKSKFNCKICKQLKLQKKEEEKKEEKKEEK